MRLLPLVLAFLPSFAGAAAFGDVLSQAGPVSLPAAPAVARAAVPASPYCVARLSAPTKGGPPYWYKADCKAAEPAKTESKWCMREDCMKELDALIDARMSASGYELASVHNFYSKRPFERVYRLKGRGAGESYCLAHRSTYGTKPWGGAPAVRYVLDCGGPLITLDNAEAAVSESAGIQRHMAKDGYALIDTFAFRADRKNDVMLFRRRAP